MVECGGALVGSLCPFTAGKGTLGQQIVRHRQRVVNGEGAATGLFHFVVLLLLKAKVGQSQGIGSIVGSQQAQTFELLGSIFEPVFLNVGLCQTVACFLVVVANRQCTFEAGDGVVHFSHLHSLHGVVGQYLEVVLLLRFCFFFSGLFVPAKQSFEKSHILFVVDVV